MMYAEDYYPPFMSEGFNTRKPITVAGITGTPFIVSHEASTVGENIEIVPFRYQFNGDDALLLRRRTDASTGFTDLRLFGATNAPAIYSLIGPDPDTYASFTFDGSNAELETNTGNLNLRNYNASGDGSVQAWSITHNQRFRIGSMNFTAALDFVHDGTNASVSTTAGSIKVSSPLNVAATTATPAGGSAAATLAFGTTAGFGIYYGSGVPTISAAQGSLYMRTDGSSTSTRMYVNTNGSTGWTNVTTAA